MPTNIFTPNMPASGNSLGYTRPLVLGNFANYVENIQRNHAKVNTDNAGKHNFIQLLNQNPVNTIAAINTYLTTNGYSVLAAGEETIYSKAFTQGELCFTRGASNVEIQLTAAGNLTNGAPVVPAVPSNVGDPGGFFLPGGYTAYFDFGLITGTQTTVTFPFTGFASQCYLVIPVLNLAGSTLGRVSVQQLSISSTGFVLVSDASGLGQQYSYIAIGI